MPTFTKHLNLRKPEENDFYNQETEQCENWDKLDKWSEGIDNKTKGATSEVAGIVKYGTDVSTALEGSKLAEILGIEYGGVLNNNNQKLAGKGYYDTSNKKIYKCTVNTSINYADAGYFIEVSNNDLLGKLQNLSRDYIVEETESYVKWANGRLDFYTSATFGNLIQEVVVNYPHAINNNRPVFFSTTDTGPAVYSYGCRKLNDSSFICYSSQDSAQCWIKGNAYWK